MTAGKDAKICLFDLRTFGGRNTGCVSTGAAAPISLAGTANWIAAAKDGERGIEFWEIVDGASPSLRALGEIKEAGTLPVRFLVHVPEFGLLSSSEDGYVSSWGDLAGVTAATIGAATPSSAKLGPFPWPPEAITQVSFGPKTGLACGAYADVEIWALESGAWSKIQKLSGHSRLVTGLA